MKKLSVVVAGTGQIRDVEIQPGTTAGDVLHQLNLPDYLLSKGPNEPFFAAAESVYDKVNNGEKIFTETASPGGIDVRSGGTPDPHRVAIRNIRRDVNEAVKKLMKDKKIAEDEERRGLDEIQKMTNGYMDRLDTASKNKEKEIMEIK